MFNQTAAAVGLSLCLVSMGCDDTEVRFAATSPGGLSPAGPAPFASIHPAFLTPQLNSGGVCPVVQPLRAIINLTLRAHADVALQLTEVRLQFFDSLGIAAPPVTLPAPVLTRQFGTALVQARSSRLFPIDFAFGCGTGRRGTIVVLVRFRDGRDKDGQEELRVRVNET